MRYYKYDTMRVKNTARHRIKEGRKNNIHEYEYESQSGFLFMHCYGLTLQTVRERASFVYAVEC